VQSYKKEMDEKHPFYLIVTHYWSLVKPNKKLYITIERTKVFDNIKERPKSR
jgi:hypothetical protein